MKRINFEKVLQMVGVVENDRQYNYALTLIERLMDAKPGSSDEKLLNVLSILVEKYEDTRYPISPPDPIAAIKFRLDQMGMTRSDLAQIIGGRNRASEILRGKRKLTPKMMRSLHIRLGVPAESLLGV